MPINNKKSIPERLAKQPRIMENTRIRKHGNFTRCSCDEFKINSLKTINTGNRRNRFIKEIKNKHFFYHEYVVRLGVSRKFALFF